MGTIICQTCEKTIAQFEDEKVSTLYGVCPHCHDCHQGSRQEHEAHIHS